MIKPINGHILIDPLEKPTFMQSEQTKFQEIGVVVDFDVNINGEGSVIDFGNGVSSTLDVDMNLIHKGDKVFFDSWLIAKYPKGLTEAEGYYWLIKWEDVRGVEYAKISE